MYVAAIAVTGGGLAIAIRTIQQYLARQAKRRARDDERNRQARRNMGLDK